MWNFIIWKSDLSEKSLYNSYTKPKYGRKQNISTSKYSLINSHKYFYILYYNFMQMN